MSSIFNTLYLGSAKDAADALEDAEALTQGELRAALINALRRIAELEASAKHSSAAINAAAYTIPIK